MNPLKVTLIYAVLGMAWIVASDWFAGQWDVSLPLDMQTLKGLLYILATSALLYTVVRAIERRLQHERAWYRELFEGNPQPMWVYDLETLKFIEVNHAAVLHYGYSREEFLSMSLLDIRPVEEVPSLLASVARARAGAEHGGIWRHRKKNGSEILVEVFSQRANFLGRDSKMVLAQDVTDRLRTEERLRNSEANLREMAENLGDVYYNYDPVHDKLLYTNDSFAVIWGHSLEEAMANPMSYLDWIHPVDRPLAEQANARQRRGEATETEYRVVRPDGSVTWVQDRSRPLVDGDGKVYRIVGTMHDITLRKKAEAALRESRALSRIAGSVGRLGGWTIDAADTGVIVTWSDEVCALHGVHPGFEPTMDIALGFFVPQHRSPVRAAIDACFRECKPFDEEYEIVRADGRHISVRVMGEAVTDEDGKVVRVQGGLQDVTELKKAEQTLLLSERRYYQLADSMPFIVWAADAGGRVDFVNRSFTEYTGTSQEKEIAKRWVESIHPEDLERCRAAWLEVVASGKSCQLEYRLRRADAVYRWHQLTVTAIHGDDGSILRWYGAVVDVHEIKEAEERANELARRLRKTLESITDAFLTMNRHWKFTYVNREAERLLGRDRDELVGRDIWQEFPHALNSVFETNYRHAMATGETVAFDAYYPEPLDKWFAVRAFPSANGLAVYFRDVTKSRMYAEKRRENEERLRLITRATNDMVWDYDMSSGMIWWGEGFEEYFGPVSEDRKTSSLFWEDCLHPEDRGRTVASVDRVCAGEGEVWMAEYRIRRLDGVYAPVLDRGFVIRDEQGKAVRMIGGITDLTDRKRAEEDLRRLAAELEHERGQLMEAQRVAKLGSWETRLQSHEVGMSEENYRIYGLDPAVYKPVYGDVFNLTHPDDRARVEQAFTTSLSQPDSPHTIAHRIVTPDGMVKHVEHNWRVEYDEGGRPLRAVGTTQDISARVELEEQFRQAQKMEAVGRLAGGVAHDFNNMLTVILMRAEQAVRRLEPGSPLRVPLEEIRDAAQRSAGLTRQLLAYARRQAVVPRIIDLNETLGAMQQMLRRLIGENIVLSWVPGEAVWSTRIDPAQVDQILANLCINARDAIRDVGRIEIETRNVSLDEEYCRHHGGHRPGDYVMIAVTDDGVGMDAQTRVHIFEPFYTTKDVGQGTGLGLATVYGIVQQNNGFIHVYSEPGQGTTFRIYLPACAADVPAAAPGQVAKSEPEHGKGETILVVEDESLILGVAVEILEGLGYTVLSTTSPQEALQIVTEYEGTIDLLINDVIMPGMNGRDLAEKVRVLRPSVRVLYMSGYTAHVIIKRGLVDRGEVFVQKPFSAEELALRVRELLDAPSEADA